MSQVGHSKCRVLLLLVIVSIFLLWGLVSHQQHSRTDEVIPPRKAEHPRASQGAASPRPTDNTVFQQQSQATALTTSTTTALPAVQHDYGYLLGLHVYDQLTGGAINILSIQCMASRLSSKLIVVEPFVINSSYGAVLAVEDRESFDRENNVKLRDIYDIDTWSNVSDSYHYNRLASWESFIDNAPRDLILVEHQWSRDCNLPALIDKFSWFFKTFNFRIVKTACLNFKKTKAMKARRFKGIVYGKYAPEQVTVIIDRLPGIGNPMGGVGPWSTAVEQPSCKKQIFYNLIVDRMPSTKRIKSDAEEYVTRYLGGKRDFVSMMIRLEHSYKPMSMPKIKDIKQLLHVARNRLRAVKNKQHLNGTFLGFDVGKYGSYVFNLRYPETTEKIIAEMHIYFDTIYNGSISYTEWEESFVEVSGVKSGSGMSGYVATLQKEIASQGRCIILIGRGSFQKSARSLYEHSHGEHSWC